eukprot:COSAG02_NODE_54496_length_295_cov_37.397959_1_plen_59_part_10
MMVSFQLLCSLYWKILPFCESRVESGAVRRQAGRACAIYHTMMRARDGSAAAVEAAAEA